ncbi:MAG: hypothetical protein ACXWZ1_07390 [Gaiellaceae bacterium]
MFVSVTRTDTAGQNAETAALVGEEMERWLRDLDGFEGFLLLTRPGESIGLVFWASEAVAERQSAVRAEFRDRMLSIAGARIESVDGYEVAFSRLGRGLGQGSET